MSEIEGEGEHQIVLTAGDRLRAAREALGLSVDDVATSTRIPTRHLTSLETGDFDRLPAPTYSVGFAKSYAGAVGLDRNEIGEQLRAEIGGTRLAPNQAEQLEPLDPARSMPRWVIFAAIAALVLVALAFSWLSNRSLNAPDNVVAEEAAAEPLQPASPPPAAAASGPVLITANEQAWIQVKDGTTLLKEGVLEPGQSFEVPPSAVAPVLTTAKAEALRISVGTADAPPIGPAATRVSNVSLLGPDLLRGPASAPAAAAPATASPPAAAPTRPASRPAARLRPQSPVPATNNNATAPATPQGQ